jgi:glycerophosphoryl diester phosphodiesterase
MKSLEIIAHRGANREAPENTIPAFQRALDIGVDGIELDIHVTRDNVPIVHHDAVLPDGGRIDRLDSADLERRTDAPTLAQILELVNGRSRLYVEIKAPAALVPSVELLKARTDWCSVHSFDHRVARRARELDSRLTAGILLVSYLVDIEHAMATASARDVWQQADFIDPELVTGVHRVGGRVIAWTVNDPGRARALDELGVDAICTDDPRGLRGLFASS